MQQTCDECGSVFQTKGSHTTTTTCGRPCGAKKAWRKRKAGLQYPNCATCGEELTRINRLYCNRKCAAQRKRKWCIVADDNGTPCGKPSESRTLGMCGTHARRHMAGIDLIRGARKRLVEGEERRYGEGYVRARINGRTVTVHRYRMEELLGRPLLPGETVHHVNGDKTDNRIDGPLDENFRSGNLELWTGFQPTGGRVADKIAWAVELLETYAPELLAARPTQLRLAS